MWQVRAFVPEGVKNYIRLMAAQLRHADCLIGSPYVGRGVLLGRGCCIVHGDQLSNGVRPGDYTCVNCGTMLVSGELGRFCSVSPSAFICQQEHPTRYLSTSFNLYSRDNPFGAPSGWSASPDPPQIGRDVWFGAFTFVRQGVKIGHGAGAVVTREAPPDAIAAGAPARVLRFRFPAEPLADLLDTRWWERSREEVAAMAERFQISWKGAAAHEAEP